MQILCKWTLVLAIFLIGLGVAVQAEEGPQLLQQLRTQELLERSAALRAKQLQYELQVAQAQHAIAQLQQPPSPESATVTAAESAFTPRLIGWTQRQGKVRFLLQIDAEIVRVWEGLRGHSGVLAERIDDHVRVEYRDRTYVLEVADAQR